MDIGNVDYSTKIPNNVGLIDDRQVLRALEDWHPGYLNWWHDMGPDGFQEALVYLRTAFRGRSEGLGQVRLCAHAGLPLGHFAGAAEENRKIHFGAAFWRTGVAGSAWANTAPCCGG